jgi:prophage antirepressor-like protein
MNKAMVALVFDYQGKRVRTAGSPEEPLFRAEDVCSVLGLGNTAKACDRLDQDEVQLILEPAKNSHESLQVRSYSHLYVTESGLYSLILGCRKEEAKAFKRWVTHEVLPAIRRTGTYSVRAEVAKKWIVENCLQEVPRSLLPMFTQLISTLAELKSERWCSGPAPKWSIGMAGWVYGWAFPECQPDRRRLNPVVGERPVRPDYDHLTDEGLHRLQYILGICVFGAEMSHSWEDWRAKMRRKFEGSTYQPWLPWGIPTRRLPPKGGRAA